MKSDSPTPEEILEELADKTVAHIDRLAPVAFDRSFDELTRYHRFLLALSASQTPEGSVVNYAEAADSAWSAPHQRWTKQYNRLFERAASRLSDDDHFIRSLAYTPDKLLPGRNDPRLPASVVSAILRLGPVMMHRLEGWITKRTVADTQEDEAAAPRLTLSGSDAKAYANVLPEIVGAWESLLQFGQLAPSMQELRELDDTDQWASYRLYWPLIWQHLTNTALCLTIAVWNEDEAGTALYREALVRWPNNLDHRFREMARLQHPQMAYPSLLDLDWANAERRVSTLSFKYMPAPSPEQVFSSLIRGAHGDVLLLASALFLFWTISERQVSDIGARTACSLLRREGADEFDRSSNNGKPALRSLFMDAVRLRSAGRRSGGGSYASDLNGLIEMLDNMTERRVVPGRAYTPTTLHSMHELAVPIVALLLATTPNDGDDGLADRIATLAREEEVLPDGDQSLRDILHGFDDWRLVLAESQSQLARCTRNLAPERDAADASCKLLAIINSAQAAIETERLKRLNTRPIDFVKLERFRSTVQEALLTEPIKIPFFVNGEVTLIPTAENAVAKDIRFTGLSTAQFTDPPMDAPTSNLASVLISGTIRRVHDYAWQALWQRSKHVESVCVVLDDDVFWENISQLVEEIDADCALVVSRSSEEETVRRIVNSSPGDYPYLTIESQPQEWGTASYIATINGVHVFGGPLAAGKALLFSTRSLLRLLYVQLSQPDQYLDIAFEAGEEMKGALRISISLRFEWSDTPIFELRSSAVVQE